jgi:type II secretory pathway component GspD/PulD (secretin)
MKAALGAVALLLGATAVSASQGLDARIDMAVRDADPKEVFESFGELLGAEASVDPAVKNRVTVELKNVRVRTLLDTVCESIGCRWEFQPGPPSKLRITALPGKAEPATPKVSGKESIDLRVTKADGRNVLATFAQILSAEPAIHPSIKGELTLDLKATPWDQALDAVCQSLSCTWELTEGAKKTLKVTPKAKG